MFKFKTFQNTNDFENWQADHRGAKIYQFSPVVLQAGVEQQSDTKCGLDVHVGCFVMYTDDSTKANF